MNEKQPKYESGIYGRAEARFGGKIAVEPVRFTNGDGTERHGLILSEFYTAGTVGEPPADQRTHEPQIQLVFDNIKSVEMMERSLATVREMMKRDAEREASETENQSNELLKTPITSCELSVRALYVCRRLGINTLGDLTNEKKIDFQARGAGKKTLTELDDLLTANGLCWKR